MTDERVEPLRVGDILYGFCSGMFGRDSYGNKRVEAIGSDWVIARNSYSGEPVFSHVESGQWKYIEEARGA